MKNIPVKVCGVLASRRAVVDDEDFAALALQKWRTSSKGYAMSSKHPQRTMHRIIMDAKRGEMLDHINGNKLDNRKSNLRFCTNTENQRNHISAKKDSASGIRGVSWEKTEKRWNASISIDGKKKNLGNFIEKLDAEDAYKAASLKFHGRFSPFAS